MIIPTSIDFESNQENALHKHRQWTLWPQLRCIILNSWSNRLFVVVLVGIALNYAQVSPTIVFAFNFVAIVPGSVISGYAVDQLVFRLGETLGGLLSMSFRHVHLFCIRSSGTANANQ